MIAQMEHVHFVALAYLATAVVLVFLVLQSLFAAGRAARALAVLEEEKNKHKDAAS